MSRYAVGAPRLQDGHSGGVWLLPDARALFSVDPADALRWLRFRGSDTPERLLSLAIMCQALTDLRRAPRGATSGKLRHLHRDTVAWFLDDDERYPFGFRALCDRFEWSPDAIRRHVLARETLPSPEPARSLRLVRRR